MRDSCLQCGGVFNGIVTDHNAFFRLKTELVQDLCVVGGIWLAAGAVFVSRVVLKISGIQTCPAYTAFCCNGGEDGIGGQDGSESQGFHQINDLSGGGGITADFLHILEICFVEFTEFGFIVPGTFAKNGSKVVPEGFFIGAGAVVLYHGGSTFPNGIDQCVCFITVGRQSGSQSLEVCFDKKVLVHR